MTLDDRGITILNSGKESDITPKELIKVQEFKEAGMPGLTKVAQNEVAMTKTLDLYMSGKTYGEIATIVGIKKDIVLYLAHKFDWYDTKMQQLKFLMPISKTVSCKPNSLIKTLFSKSSSSSSRKLAPR
jgi:hypothetical protein